MCAIPFHPSPLLLLLHLELESCLLVAHHLPHFKPNQTTQARQTKLNYGINPLNAAKLTRTHPPHHTPQHGPNETCRTLPDRTDLPPGMASSPDLEPPPSALSQMLSQTKPCDSGPCPPHRPRSKKIRTDATFSTAKKKGCRGC
jgi:hypothetical protein